MSTEVIQINNIEQFRQLVEKLNLTELVARDKRKKFKSFYKFAFNNLQQEKGKDAVEKALNAINKNSDLLKNGINKIDKLANLQQLGLVLDGINLFATVAGFKIMNKKLNDMSDSIEQQFNELKHVVKQVNDTTTHFEYKKVIEDHSDMLDARRIQKPYSEEKMRELVSRESSVLGLLIEIIEKKVSADKGSLLLAIISMLSMLTASLIYFDEIYYINNHEAISDGKVWHTSHDTWMEAYDILSSDSFTKLVQDCGVIDMDLSTPETDELYISFTEKVRDLRQEVLDNQTLVVQFADIGALKEFKHYSNEEVKAAINEAFREAFNINTGAEKIFNDAIEKVCQAA